MPTTITVDPVTRIEGHLKIEVTVDAVGSELQVVDAKSSGTMFRGFEKILLNHDPLDAVHITQRICGVCPVSHGMASCKNLESAFAVGPPDNGRILRNLVLAANFIQSHVLHFYHLAALDYINTTGVLDMAPWTPRYVTADMVTGPVADTLVAHYVEALAVRRKAHQMGAILGGKLPCCPTFVPGGCTEAATQEKVDAFAALLADIQAFIDNTYIPDVLAVAGAFGPYYDIGQGCGNLLAYGVFEQGGGTRFLPRGRYTNAAYDTVDPASITEDVAYSWYASGSGLNPAAGQTEADPDKAGAYSWIKSPRYGGIVHEVGPLARMWISGDYTDGISVLDRLAARAYEAKKIADAMPTWLSELDVTGAGSSYTHAPTPASGSGIGLTEAPRGALGHWIDITNSKISRYQVVTPTAWNASPKDDTGQPGPIEQALIGTPMADISKPIELLRVVHSFDPCLACSVHMLRPGKKEAVTVPISCGI